MAEWASQFEGEHGATELVGLAVDSRGDVALAGHVFEEGGFADGRKDAIVMKLASGDGSALWTRNIGVSGSHDWSSAVAADREGNIFVGGQTDGTLFANPAGDGQDIWVAKLDGVGGELLWGYQVGSTGQDVASTLTVDSGAPGSDVVVCGSTTGGLFEDPGFLFDGGNAAGVEGGANRGTEAFCAKLAALDGHVLWGTRLQGGLNDGILAAAVDPLTGDVFATGYTAATGGSDYIVVRLSGRDGSERWRSTGGGGWMSNGYADARVRDSACALAVDGRGNVVIAGNTEGALFSSTVAGQDTDAFVAKLDGGNGTRLWGWQGGSVGNDYANAVAVDPSGDVYACGAAPRGMFAAADAPAPPQAGGEAVAGPAGGGQVGNAWSNDVTSSASRYGQGGGAVADMFVAKLDGQSGGLLWGQQFGSGADDEAVGLMLGPDASVVAVDAEETVGSPEQEAGGGGGGGGGGRGGNPLYLTGWTRGALFSKVPARWQDGWAVKLPNPPPKTLGVSGGRVEPVAVAGGPGAAVGGASSAGAQQAAVERGAVTAGFVGTVTGMLVVVSLGLYFVLRKATHAGGALSTARYDSVKEGPDDPTKGLFRRRGRPNLLHEAGGKGGGGGGNGGGGKTQDGVELTLLSESSVDGGGRALSPRASRSIAGAGGNGGAGGGVGGGRRDASPPSGAQQATFYL